MNEPPYWPYRCKACSRFVSNPRVTYNMDSIVAERGDCSRCGPQVPLVPLCWEDWFGEGDPYGEMLVAIAAAPSPPSPVPGKER